MTTLKRERLVYTYAPQGRPHGLLIASEAGDNGIVVEHAIVLPGAPQRTLRGMLRAGWDAALTYGYRAVMVWVPVDDPRAGTLAGLLMHYGFVPYAEQPDGAWWHRGTEGTVSHGR